MGGKIKRPETILAYLPVHACQSITFHLTNNYKCMKNNLHFEVTRSPILCRIRAACFVFMLTLLLPQMVSAQNGVTIKRDQATVGQIIEEITRQTNYTFSYSKEVIDLNRRVTVSAESADINNVLEQVFKGSNETFRVSGNRIYLSAKGPGARVNATITGRVVDESGQAMIGVAVRQEVNNVGVTTGKTVK